MYTTETSQLVLCRIVNKDTTLLKWNIFKLRYMIIHLPIIATVVLKKRTLVTMFPIRTPFLRENREWILQLPMFVDSLCDCLTLPSCR